ncbi:MAG: hypothetical protein Q4E51_08105 [Lachnospiraceae bacterium]|nr:hypothetical protein [Lachnospiraceae bacterium]
MSNREYKSDVFSMLMEYPEYALDVYKALGGRSDAKPSMVEIKTLEKGISLSVRNDAAFIIDTELSLYEHQSTYNPNMPLRSLIYLAEILKPMVKNKDLYSKKLIKIPKPKFVVFYNGEDDRPEKEIQKLSTAYSHAGDSKDSIELTCTVYNINPDKNNDLKKLSYVLDGYMTLVNKVRELKSADKDYDRENEDVVKEAVEYCIDNHILEEFFRERGSEVVKNMTIDMTFETRQKLFTKEAYEDGIAEGKEEGKAMLLKAMLKDGTITIEKAAEYADMSVDELKKVIED